MDTQTNLDWSSATVSVVIPHYGDPEPTRQLCRTLITQAHQVIVSDDCSPEPFGHEPGVTVVRRQQNGGFGAACNSGARRASGDLLLFLNSDAQVGDSFVPDLRTQAAPWQPCVAGPLIREGLSTNASARRFPTVGQHAMEWLVPLSRFHSRRWMSWAIGHDTKALAQLDSTPTDWVVGAALLVPRDQFEAVGGFDEEFFMNSEEIDLQKRLAFRGVISLFVPVTDVLHVGGGSSDPTRRLKWVVDSWRIYSAKWGGGKRLIAALWAATLVNFSWNLGRKVAGRKAFPLKEFRTQCNVLLGPIDKPQP